MTLGYFLRTFLGFEKFAIGNMKGKIGEDWWPVEAEMLDDEIRRLSWQLPQADKGIEIAVFNQEPDELTLFHPWIKEDENNVLELTHVRLLESKDTLLVRALRNGQPPELPMYTVEKLIEVARKRLKN